jgi:peptide deformylase
MRKLLEVLKHPNPILRSKSDPVLEFTDELREFIQDLAEAMYFYGGVGLAAPQVGKLWRIFVVDVADPNGASDLKVFINPRVVSGGGRRQTYKEGCLSLPNRQSAVLRPPNIFVQAQDGNGRFFALKAEGLLARVIQHEYDHLEGVLMLDQRASANLIDKG